MTEQQTTKPMFGFEHYRGAKFIRVSALIEYIKCPRSYFYHYGCGLVSQQERLPLTFGEAIHSAIGWLLRFPGDIVGSCAAFDKVWTERFEKLGSDENKGRSRDYAISMIMHWMQTHSANRSLWQPVEPPSGMLISNLERTSDYELPFAFDIGAGIPIVGRIDAVAKHRDTGEIWLWELKTGSEFTWNILPNCFFLHPQILSYNLAVRLGGIPATRGTIVETILVSKKRRDQHTIPVEIPDHLIDDHIKLLRWKVRELLEFERVGEFPKTFACNPYYAYGSAGFNCEYLRLCQTEDWTKLKMLYREYRDEPFIVKPTIDGKEIV